MSKKKSIFELPYVGVEEDDYPVLYHEQGHYSVVFEVKNNIRRYNGDDSLYQNYHNVFNNILKILGAGHHIQKIDVFSTQQLKYDSNKNDDFLSQSYFENFEGRNYKNIRTFLIINKINKRSTFIKYDSKIWKTFNINIKKIQTILSDNDFKPKILIEEEIDLLFRNFLGFNFKDQHFSIGNIKAGDEHIEVGGNKIFKSASLIDVDEVNLPSMIRPNHKINVGYDFPTDLFTFFYDLHVDLLIYNQVIEINDQIKERRLIEQKRDRHNSMPDPSNDLAVKDIDGVLEELAQSNQLLINCHFSLSFIDKKEKVNVAYNDFESKLFDIGIIPSKRTFNQFEILESILPGNTSVLQDYDYFKTTIDPALCFLYKESLIETDDSEYLFFFSDREGVPVGIDLSEIPMSNNIINNRNKFILGPSGSGKSFFMNHMVRQYMLYDTDVVLVDVGHSYSGVCDYYNGSYITYTQEKPITMNPFFISPEEYNQEKKDSLRSLIGLLWKGVDGSLSVVENTVLSNAIKTYFEYVFENDKTNELCFNNFYDYSIEYIQKVIEKDKIDFKLTEYKYVLRSFYKGGEYESLLNANMDSSLFEEKLIVFEIDSIKDNKTLFPIVTLIIMDVFIQKMRLKDNKKVLIIEEAWKAIASPMMADYILYLYKTVRKFYGEAMLVTQELEDIIKSEVLKNSVINNSDTIILLDQSKFKDNYDDVCQLLSINEVEKNKIFTINNLDNKNDRGRFKEVYISMGGKGDVWGVEVSLKEYLTFSTEFKEKKAVQNYAKKYGGFKEGLIQFEKDFKASKLSLPQFVSKVNSHKDIV